MTMEGDAKLARCFACLELSATGLVQSIFTNDGEIADFLQKVGIKLPQADAECKLLLCRHCQKCIKKFQCAFVRFVECLQDGIDQQMGGMEIEEDSKPEKLAKAEERRFDDLSVNLASLMPIKGCTDMRSERDHSSFSSADFEAMEVAPDYSSFSDDSFTADLEQPEKSDDAGTRRDELSEISSFDDLNYEGQETLPEKSLGGGVTEQQIKERESRAIVDYSDFDGCDSIDDQPLAARLKTPKVNKCKICESTFSSESHLRRHIVQTHLKMTRVACELCLEIFPVRASFIKHSAQKHGIKVKKETRRQIPNFCNHCGKVFASARILTEHYYSIIEAGK